MEAHDAALFDGIMSEVESFVLAGDLECALETLRMAERINPKDGVLRRKIAEVNQLAGLAPVPTVEAAAAATKAAQHRFAHLVAVGKYAPPRTTLSAAERRTRARAVQQYRERRRRTLTGGAVAMVVLIGFVAALGVGTHVWRAHREAAPFAARNAAGAAGQWATVEAPVAGLAGQKTRPHFVGTLRYWQGRLAERAGKLSDAETWFTMAWQADTTVWEALARRARVRRVQGKAAAALADYGEAFRRFGAARAVWLEYADLLLRERQRDQAAAVYSVISSDAHHPDRLIARARLGAMAAEAGRSREALEWFRGAAQPASAGVAPLDDAARAAYDKFRRRPSP